MTSDNRRSGLGALIGAFVLCVASLALVLWMVAVSSGEHSLFTETSFDAPVSADIASRTRAAP